MSAETQDWLDNNVLVGFCAERSTAWHHRKGTNNHFDGAIPMERIDSMFSWDAVETPLYVVVNGETIEVPNRKAITRSDSNHVMGIHGEGYAIHQYREELVNANRNLLDDDNLSIGSAGLLRGGARAWVQIEMPENITVDSVGEAFRPSLLVASSHDGSLATTRKLVITRVVCDNTESIALSESGPEHKIRHSKNSKFKLNDARSALGILHKVGDQFTESIMAMCSQEVTDKQWSAFVQEFYPLDDDASGAATTRAQNSRDALTEFYRTDARVAPWKGTAWGVAQSVNTFWNHSARVNKGTERVERNMEGTLAGKVEEVDRKTMSILDKVLVTA